jgi:hypothetical protein
MYGVSACNKCETVPYGTVSSSFFSDYLNYYERIIKMSKESAVLVNGVQASTLNADEHRGSTSMRGLLKAVTAGVNSANWDKESKLEGGNGLPVIYSTSQNNRLTGLVFQQNNGNPKSVTLNGTEIEAQKPKLEFEVVAWDSDDTPEIHSQIREVFQDAEKDANGNAFVRVIISGNVGFNQTAYSRDSDGNSIINNKGTQDKPFYELAIRPQANTLQLTATNVEKLIS